MPLGERVRTAVRAAQLVPETRIETVTAVTAEELLSTIQANTGNEQATLLNSINEKLDGTPGIELQLTADTIPTLFEQVKTLLKNRVGEKYPQALDKLDNISLAGLKIHRAHDKTVISGIQASA